MTIQRLRGKPTEAQALSDFEYLKSIGMHGSAYNLLYENQMYQDLSWDRDALKSKLKTDTICCRNFWIEDTTK